MHPCPPAPGAAGPALGSLEPPLTLRAMAEAEGIARDDGVRLGPLPPERRVVTLGPALLPPGGDALYDLEGKRLDASCLRRGAALERFPLDPPERIDPGSLGAVEEVPTLVFLPYLEFAHFGHLLTETAGWLGPLLDPGVDWLGATGPEAVWMVAAQGADAMATFERLLPPRCRRWRCSADLSGPLLARRVLLPVPSMRNGHSITAGHPRHLRLLLERLHGPTTRLPPQVAAPADGSRLYLSRSRLDPSQRRILEEEALEHELRARGWRIAWPETQPIGVQLQQLRDASVIAAPNGSALHLLLYYGTCLAGRRVLSLYVPGSLPNPNFLLQARLQELDWLVLGCLSPDPDCVKPLNVRRDLWMIAGPGRTAELLDELAASAGAAQSPAPPRNRC